MKYVLKFLYWNVRLYDHIVNCRQPGCGTTVMKALSVTYLWPRTDVIIYQLSHSPNSLITVCLNIVVKQNQVLFGLKRTTFKLSYRKRILLVFFQYSIYRLPTKAYNTFPQTPKVFRYNLIASRVFPLVLRVFPIGLPAQHTICCKMQCCY